MKYMKYVLIVSYFFLLGCISENPIGTQLSFGEEERAARQGNAFDISGAYETTEDSEVQLNFKITNQEENSDGFNPFIGLVGYVGYDIFIELERTSPILRKEKERLSELAKEHEISENILIEDLEKNFISFTLGKDSPLFGGDNYSDDSGETSQFHVCSKAMEYNSKKVVKDLEGTKSVIFVIQYCLSGVVKKENKNLIEGQLIFGSAFDYVGGEEIEFSAFLDEDLVLNYKAVKSPL